MLMLLESLGANVYGYSLSDSNFPLYERIKAKISHIDTRGDIRNSDALKREITAAKPDLIIHLAAQSLLCVAKRNPLETFEINVMGTAVLLNIASEFKLPVLAVSSDKCIKCARTVAR